MAKTKKEMTIDDLAIVVKRGFEAAKKHTNEKFDAAKKHTNDKIDELAQITARGFETVDKQFKKNDEMHQLFVDEFRLARKFRITT